jgi:hypothetical protein
MAKLNGQYSGKGRRTEGRGIMRTVSGLTLVLE